MESFRLMLGLGLLFELVVPGSEAEAARSSIISIWILFFLATVFFNPL